MIVFKGFFWARFLIILVVSLAILSPAAYASQLGAKRSQLNGVNAKIQENQGKQNAIEQREAEILQAIQVNDQKFAQLQIELNNLQAELTATVAMRQATETKLHETQKRLEESRFELGAAQQKLAERRKVYDKRLVAAYKNGRSKQVVAVLLNSRDFNDFAKRVGLIGKIAVRDGNLVFEMKDLVREISAKVAQIEYEKQTINEQLLAIIDQERRIVAVRNQVAVSQNSLKEEVDKQKSLLAQARQEKVQLEQTESMLQASSDMLIDQILVLQKRELGQKSATGWQQGALRNAASADVDALLGGIPVPPEGSGRFMRPVPGIITSGFGWRLHPILKTSRLHTGIDFRAATATPVAAAQSGTVIIAGWMGGYGNVVVIDHGNGISTLYAHNSDLVVGVGQRVFQGQIIARAGSTGLSTGPHVHFEVRKNGRPVNPTNWIL